MIKIYIFQSTIKGFGIFIKLIRINLNQLATLVSNSTKISLCCNKKHSVKSVKAQMLGVTPAWM